MDSCVGACSCRRTGSHFAGTCARLELDCSTVGSSGATNSLSGGFAGTSAIIWVIGLPSRSSQGEGRNHHHTRSLFSLQPGRIIHGPQILQKGLRQGRARDGETQGRHLEERALRQEGQKPQAGDRDRTFRGAGGRQKSPEEKLGQESLEEKEIKEVKAAI